MLTALAPDFVLPCRCKEIPNEGWKTQDKHPTGKMELKRKRNAQKPGQYQLKTTNAKSEAGSGKAAQMKETKKNVRSEDEERRKKGTRLGPSKSVGPCARKKGG